MESHNTIETITKLEETLENFSTEPDLNSIPASIFSEVNFIEKNNYLYVQIALNDIDLVKVKLTASGKTLIVRIHRDQENNFIRIISLPVQVNIEQGKADYADNILTICFPILSTSREINIQHR